MSYTFEQKGKTHHRTKNGFQIILSGIPSRVFEKLYRWREYSDDFISFDELIQAVWGVPDSYFVRRSLDVHLCKIKDAVRHRYEIERKHGHGVRLVRIAIG